MAYKEERQLELLMGVYREMKKLESHTKDPVIRGVVNDSDKTIPMCWKIWKKR